jgi:nucleotide-binding universal stress UspA family protein
MYSAIVVGTDGSPTAELAVRQAADLAKAVGAKLHIVSAYRATAAYVGPEAPMLAVDPVELHTWVENVLKESALKVGDLNLDVETHAVAGEPAQALIDVAEASKADLIVVGNRNMSGARRILGSVPNRVAHNADCDVLIAATCE